MLIKCKSFLTIRYKFLSFSHISEKPYFPPYFALISTNGCILHNLPSYCRHNSFLELGEIISQDDLYRARLEIESKVARFVIRSHSPSLTDRQCKSLFLQSLTQDMVHLNDYWRSTLGASLFNHFEGGT